jgi:hypothetical protein
MNATTVTLQSRRFTATCLLETEGQDQVSYLELELRAKRENAAWKLAVDFKNADFCDVDLEVDGDALDVLHDLCLIAPRVVKTRAQALNLAKLALDLAETKSNLAALAA